jgi:hypothetical protein
MTHVEWLSRRLLWGKNTCTKQQNLTWWVGHMAFDHTQRTKFSSNAKATGSPAEWFLYEHTPFL